MLLIARQSQKKELLRALDSPKAELVAVYGRRRVGKTFLVSQTCGELANLAYFQLSGSLDEDGRPISRQEWLMNFSLSYFASFGERKAFRTVEDCLIEIVRLSKEVQIQQQRLLIFIDELPWFAKSCPEFYRGFVNLWNNTLSKNPLVKVIVAGSATSWMMEKIVQARTAMAKRITAKIYLKAFDLEQTREFLQHQGFYLSPSQFFQLYSALGGIPYYLEALNPRKSIRENLYDLFISANGLLSGKDEYHQLFRYLFNNHEEYKKITDVLAQKKYGMTLGEISDEIESSKKPSGALSRRVKDLTVCDILEQRTSFLNKRRGQYYFIGDEFIRFHSKWLRDKNYQSRAAFNRIFDSQTYQSWQGFDFELSIFKNSHLVMHQLNISGMAITPHIFYQESSTQIDLLLDRADDTVTICEVKSYEMPYKITKSDIQRFNLRRQALVELFKRKRKSIPHINCCFIVKNGMADTNTLRELDPLVVDFSYLGIE